MKKLSDLGERKAIEIISEILSKGNEVIGIGDDCTAYDMGNKLLLISTDMITKKTHIPKKMTPWQIGWFIVAINISDIAAKGGKPIGMVLSIGIPKDTTEDFFKKIIKGAENCSKKYGFTISGGDTKENTELTISGTIFGTVKKENFMPRKGCKPGDIVVVTGNLGKAGAGYYAIQKNIENKKIIEELLEPKPRLKEGIVLASKKIISSSMDISDGLSSSLYQLKKINNVGFKIYKNKIPISKKINNFSKKNSYDIYKSALHYGGDYELLITMPKKHFKKLEESIKNIDSKITEIGIVTKEKNIKIIENQVEKKLENKGFEHFK